MIISPALRNTAKYITQVMQDPDIYQVPSLYSFLMSIDRIEATDTGHTAYVEIRDGLFVISINPNFDAQLDMEQLKFVLIHEFAHIFYEHHSRYHRFRKYFQKKYNQDTIPDLWNVACDIIINETIMSGDYRDLNKKVFRYMDPDKMSIAFRDPACHEDIQVLSRTYPTLSSKYQTWINQYCVLTNPQIAKYLEKTPYGWYLQHPDRYHEARNHILMRLSVEELYEDLHQNIPKNILFEMVAGDAKGMIIDDTTRDPDLDVNIKYVISQNEKLQSQSRQSTQGSGMDSFEGIRDYQVLIEPEIRPGHKKIFDILFELVGRYSDVSDHDRWDKVHRSTAHLYPEVLLPCDMGMKDKATPKLLVICDVSGSCLSYMDEFFRISLDIPEKIMDVRYFTFSNNIGPCWYDQDQNKWINVVNSLGTDINLVWDLLLKEDYDHALLLTDSNFYEFDQIQYGKIPGKRLLVYSVDSGDCPTYSTLYPKGTTIILENGDEKVVM